MPKPLPIGKLPHELLARFLAQAPLHDPRVLQGPGVGLDCAILDLGDTLLALKSDPITFATEEIGWYGVQVNANDIATAGAHPRWFLITLLLPEETASEAMAEGIASQIFSACREIGVDVIGGHTEITHSIDRPIFVGTMIGEVARDRLVTSRGAQPGDRVLLTKGIPIETTAILAREFPERLSEEFTPQEIEQAKDYLYDPGISVLKDALLAVESGQVNAMHDPTEGGLATALWELAQASQKTLIVDPEAAYVPELSRRMCEFFELDPWGAIASGALLLTSPTGEADQIRVALASQAITCVEIGRVEEGSITVKQETSEGLRPLPRPDRDEIARLFEE
jgi:hydrogenase expression/formation protein HypE